MGPFIDGRGGVHDRFKMGYRNVIDRAAETTPEPALLAIETSGHSGTHHYGAYHAPWDPNPLTPPYDDVA